MHIQDLAGVAHDDIDPSVFSISGDEQKAIKVNNNLNALSKCT